MQEWMQNFLSPDRVSKTERINNVRESLIDYGFYHDLRDVTRMYAEYINNKHYGYAGGVMDQPDGYWHDMNLMRNLAFYVEELLPFATDGEQKDFIQQIKDNDELIF